MPLWLAAAPLSHGTIPAALVGHPLHGVIAETQHMANNVTRARNLLAEHGHVRSQLISDWGGSILLPVKVADYYDQVGPVDITIRGYGNPYFLPRLEKLWDFQAGYRWNGITGEAIEDWDDEWLVIADEGGDPFIFDRASSKVLFARHGEGAWNPEKWFDDLPTMAACLATLGCIVRTAGDSFTDADFCVRPEHRAQAIERIAEIVGSRSGAQAIVEGAGWG
jgi:hypothetical protein